MREEKVSAATSLYVDGRIFVQWHNISEAMPTRSAAKGGFSVAHTTGFKSYADLMHSIAEDVREDCYTIVHVSSSPGTVLITCQSRKTFAEFAAARMKRRRMLSSGRFDELLVEEALENMSIWLA